MIKINNLTKEIEYTILNNLSFTFDKGEIYLLKGISGSGKTTLLNILAGVDNNYTGEVLTDGNDLKEMDDETRELYRSKVGYVYQDSLLFSGLSIIDNLLFIRNDLELITKYTQIFGVEELLNRYPSEISGGQRQRVSLIRSLLYNPKYIFADEPTASLDPNNSRNVASEFKKLSTSDNVIIIATHGDYFDDVATSIIHLEYGDIVEVAKNDHSLDRNEISNSEDVDSTISLKLNLKYVKSKFKGNLFLNVVIGFVIALIISGAGFLSNFYSDSLNKITYDFPVEVISINEDDFQSIKNEVDYEILNYYRLENSNGSYLGMLFNEEDSILRNRKIFEAGGYPSSKNEVVITKEYAMGNYDIDDSIDLIGETINFENYTFTIAGVIDTSSEVGNYFTVENCHYSNSDNSGIYATREVIMEIGEQVNNGCITLKVNNLYSDSNILKILRSKNISLFWDGYLNNTRSSLEMISLLVVIIICFVMLISFIFIGNQISIKMFYRRKEVGYMQLFNVSKNRIRVLFVIENVMNFAISVIASFIFVVLIYTFVNHYVSHNTIPSIFVITSIYLFLFSYVVLLVLRPINKTLRKEVIELIR